MCWRWIASRTEWLRASQNTLAPSRLSGAHRRDWKYCAEVGWLLQLSRDDDHARHSRVHSLGTVKDREAQPARHTVEAEVTIEGYDAVVAAHLGEGD